jgi:S1-C subfamily serine protease
MEERMAYCARVHDLHRASLHAYPNVVGTGVSLKVVKNSVTDVPCIVVFVKNKVRPKELLPRAIPEKINGIPTDVVEAGTPVLRHYTTRIRPVPPGYSIGHTRVTVGTLGCLVRDRDAKETLILSNNHVMADSNRASLGDPIVQPGPYDGGSHPSDTIAHLVRWKPIVSRGNKVDAAVARPIRPDAVTPNIPGIGIPRGVRKMDGVGVFVQKVGRTTQHTTGIVTAYNASIYPLNYPGIGSVEFVSCIVTTGMSAPGDSGSLLLDMDKRATGLLFAGMEVDGKEVVTYYNDILNVQKELDVDLITA